MKDANNSKPLIIFCGLSGSGKSFNAKQLQQYLPDYNIVGPGILREQLNIKKYTRKDTPQLLAKVIEQIEENLKENKGSIVDANLKSLDVRQFFHDTAKELDIDSILIETYCSSETTKSRMEKREQKTPAENPKKFSVYLEQKRSWQDTLLDLELEANNHVSLIRVNTETKQISQIRTTENSTIINKIVEILKK